MPASSPKRARCRHSLFYAIIRNFTKYLNYMTRFLTRRRGACALPALVQPLLTLAGNIPQYRVTKGDASYNGFDDRNPLKGMLFNSGNGILFADGKMSYDSEKTTQGFPIGFDFRFGGKYFDQFAVSNHGELYLGKGEVDYGTTAFSLGMSTITCGLYKADVTYKTEGEEGERVLTVQYSDAC